MDNDNKPHPLLALAIWHLDLAIKLLQRSFRSGDTAQADPAASLSPKPDEPPAVPPGTPPGDTKEAGAEPPRLVPFPRQLPPLGQSAEDDVLTKDVIEVRGRLGTDDHREWKINNKPPIRLERREHTVLLILGWWAKCVAAAPTESRKRLPAFTPVKVVVAIVDKLTGENGPLSGRWPYPVEPDIYRCVSELRRHLRELGLNPNLIETGQRLAGYRLSTAVSNIIVEAAPEPAGKFWSDLFDSVLKTRGGSGDVLK